MAELYRERGAITYRSLVAEDTVGLLATYLSLQVRNGSLDTDRNQVVGAHTTYGDPLYDAVLARLAAPLSEITGLSLLPTYSFVRVYYEGQALSVHSDRPACEHSVTVHLAASDPEPWPVWFRDRSGKAVGVDLEPGDGAVYLGCELDHWRDPCPVGWYAQAFFHFVDRAGPHADELYDRRPYLGHPASARGTAETSTPIGPER